MGCCCSAADVQVKEDLIIGAAISDARAQENRTIKLLILGTGESGKSTVFKQLQLLYQQGFTQEMRGTYREVVRENALESMKNIIRAGINRFSFQFENSEESMYADTIMELHDLNKADQTIIKIMEYLWKKSKLVRRSYERRSEFYLIDSADL